MRQGIAAVICLCILMGCGFVRERLLLWRKVRFVDIGARSTLDSLIKELGVPAGTEEYFPGTASAGSFVEINYRKDAWGRSWPLDLRGYRAGKVLQMVIGPSYAWYFDHGVLNVRPKTIQSTDPLERRIAHFSVKDLSADEAANQVYSRVGIAKRTVFSRELWGGLGIPFFGKVTLDLKDMTARQMLNRIAAAEGKLTWQVAWTRRWGWIGDVEPRNWSGNRFPDSSEANRNRPSLRNRKDNLYRQDEAHRPSRLKMCEDVGIGR